ncbi:MAG: hypothetical protein LBU36_01920 [Clostridiales bacterium]|jgi:uncharacterized membrane protein|nr:hypothetical protein [Clostridiales bacterium]
MNQPDPFEPRFTSEKPPEKKPLDPASLTLSIIGVAIPVIGLPCAVVGLILATLRKHSANTSAAFFMSLIGIFWNALAAAVVGAFVLFWALYEFTPFSF